MSFEIEFDYELKQLGLVLKVWAEYENGGGGSDEPAYGPECTSISAIVCDELDLNANDVWEGLADLYEIKMSNKLVWVAGSDGWHIQNVYTGMRVDMASHTFLPMKIGARLWEIDSQGRQKVYELVRLQDVIQSIADEKAAEAEADGAGQPDPDEGHDND